MWTQEIREHLWSHTSSHLTGKSYHHLQASDLTQYFGMLLIFSCYPARNLHRYFTKGVGKIIYPAQEHFLSQDGFIAFHAQVRFDLATLHSSLIESLSLHDNSGYLFDFTSPSSSITPFNALLFFADRLASIRPGYKITADTRFSNLEQATEMLAKGVFCTLVCKASSPTPLFKNGLLFIYPSHGQPQPLMGL